MIFKNLDRLKLEVRRSAKSALLLLGVIILGTAGFAALASQTNFNNPFTEKYHVWATFSADVKGSQPGSQVVMISGVKVGIVTKARLTDDNRAQLRLSIEEKYGRLFRDANVRLRPVTPLQDMYIDVERGTRSAGELPKGASLPAEQTVTPVDISRILDTFDAPTRQRIGPLLTEMGRTLGDRAPQLNAAFAKLTPFLQTTQRIASVMARHKRALSGAVHNLGELTTTLGQRSSQLRGFVRNGESVLGRLAQSDAPLSATIRELGPAMTSIRSSFAAVRGATTDLDPATDALREIAGPLPQGLSSLRGFSSEATPALDALRRPLRELTPLLTSLRPTAGALDTAFRRLEPQATRLDQITDQVNRCRDGNAGRESLPTDFSGAGLADFFHNTLSVIKFSDSNGAIPRSESVEGANSVGNKIDDGQSPIVGSCADPFPTGQPMPAGTP